MVGGAEVVSGLAPWVLYFQSSSWERREVTIESVHARHTRSGLRVECAYSYTVQGRAFTANRVGVEAEHGAHTGGPFQHRRAEVLQKHFDEKKPFLAWVNPADAGESLLFREVTGDVVLNTIISIPLVIAGVVVFLVGVWKMTAGKRLKKRRTRHPDRPWLREELWDNFTVSGNKLEEMTACWLLGLFPSFVLLVFFMVFGMIENTLFRVFVRLVLVPVAILPMWLLGKAFYLALQYIRYGNPVLMLSRIPIVPGSQFSGSLVVPRGLAVEHGIELTFKCVKTTLARTTKSSNDESENLHSETKTVARDMAWATGKGWTIPVAFDVPVGLPDRKKKGNPTYVWTLETKAGTLGIKFSATFDLPVYSVPDKSMVGSRPAV